MSMFNLAGYLWNPALVGWGSPGPTPNVEMLGYWPKKRKGKGKFSAAERQRQTVNVWNVAGVYALYKSRSLIYVGQGQPIGPRLLAHQRSDHLVGRWDAFSWASPASLRFDGDGSIAIEDPGPKITVDLATWLDEVEAFGILTGQPMENSQYPNFGDHTYWLTQVKSQHAKKDVDDLLREILERLPK